MRLKFATESEAKAKADSIHAWMQANDKAYAQSVADGLTTAWCIPYQITDENGKVLDPNWYVNVKDRCLESLAGAEKNSLV